jgi:hypothetical protein
LSGNDFAVDLIGSLTGGPIAGGGGIAQPFPPAQVVPEPSTIVLLTIGTLGLLAAARRRKKV